MSVFQYRVLLLRKVCFKCRICNLRVFHKARDATPPRKPSLVRQKRAQDRQQLKPPEVRTIYDFEESLPPQILLDVAHKSGVLRVLPSKAIVFLRRYLELAPKASPGWEKRLCAENNISPSVVAVVAGILRRCQTKSQRALAKSLMLAASDMGEKAATFEIISSSLRANVLKNYPGTLHRLENLAREEGDLQAMMLLGKVMFHNNQERGALMWLRRATQPPTGNLEFAGAGEALSLQGQILLKCDEPVGAKAAFDKAAKELDDPFAYYCLSRFEANGSPSQQAYLLKAAMTGVTEAWHELGMIELAKIQERGVDPKTLDEYGMAREWFKVAANDGNGLSMLKLATICKAVGRKDDALGWLEKAESVKDAVSQATTLRLKWQREINQV